MELTAFEKLVRQNRSYRGFDESRKVDREELLRMVDCARLTASSVNLQPLKYYHPAPHRLGQESAGNDPAPQGHVSHSVYCHLSG